MFQYGRLIQALCRSATTHGAVSLAVCFVVLPGHLALASPQDESSSEAKSVDSTSPVELIDSAIEQHWKEFGLKPSKTEDDRKWMRRVFLDIIGRIPNAEEVYAFERLRVKDRRQILVDQLLFDDRYTEEFVRHWSATWSNILIGRSGGMTQNSLVNREGMSKYLRDSFANGKPYNVMVHELVTATGTSKPGEDGFNGATNFLADKVNDERATLATSATARIFLGLRLQCAQCHNHPSDKWKQNSFWELNAFFRQTRALRRFVSGTNNVNFIELVDEDFAGEARPPTPEQADIYFDQPNGVTKVAYPVYIDGTAINQSGYVNEVNRRAELGKLILEHENLGRMMVNRTWAHFLGYGFTRPIDDLGQNSPVSHPDLLDGLADEFRKANYDVRQLIRWIALSKPYQLSSISIKANAADDPSQGEMPQFTHFYTRQMSAEQLYESLITVGGQTRGTLEQQQAERDRWLSQFTIAFGTDEGDESTTFNGSIPQVLMMFNGELVRNACETQPGSFLGRLLAERSTFEDKVRELYKIGLARTATNRELQAAAQIQNANPAKPENALQDIWWAILNSNEFIMVH